MGFWKRVGKGFGKAGKIIGRGAIGVGRIAIIAAARTAASGKPITLGNIGRAAGEVVTDRQRIGQ